jgi:hypothetical protein
VVRTAYTALVPAFTTVFISVYYADLVPVHRHRLGMLLGTRLWYGFYGQTATDDGKFSAKIEELSREISKKQATVSMKTAAKEVIAISPKSTVAPAPAPLPAPSPAPAPALVPAPADDSTSQARAARAARAAALAPAPAANLAQTTAVASQSSMGFAEVAAFFREERVFFEQKMEQQRQSMELQLRKAKPQSATDAISDTQLEALQARLRALHRAKLLDEDVLFCIEDTIADCIEVLPKADVTEHSVEQTQRMVSLSEKILVDESLARQLVRKFGKQRYYDIVWKASRK